MVPLPIYTKVKHFGDVERGVATQCMKASKCFGANNTYFSNIGLKLNVKLGGIHPVPGPNDIASALLEPSERTMVIGPDVIHPSPGSEGHPSFAALAANSGRDIAKCISETRDQESRQEIIADFEEMTKAAIEH